MTNISVYYTISLELFYVGNVSLLRKESNITLHETRSRAPTMFRLSGLLLLIICTVYHASSVVFFLLHEREN